MGVKLKKQKLAHLKTSYLYSHDIYHMQNSKQSTPPLKKQTKKKKKKKKNNNKKRMLVTLLFTVYIVRKICFVPQIQSRCPSQ